MRPPIVAITMGDAAGIGPEVCVKALASEAAPGICRALVIGDVARLRRAAEIARVAVGVRPIGSARDAAFEPGTIDCIDLGLIPADLRFGEISAVAGDAAYRYIERAIGLALAGDVAAICTAPVNKAALHAGGHVYPGHTEILAHLTGTSEVSMMLCTPVLRVIHCTTHVGLLDAIGRIDVPLVERTIRRGRDVLVRWGIAAPRLAVCGINPHAGEGGLFGRGEEESKIAPAVASTRAMGIDVAGPLPADTVFFRAVRGDFDLVVAMYHDQGHCPVKVLGLESGVNITVGLPVIRTSVDHGTAFDIAGTGVADERSLLEALRQAASLASGVRPQASGPAAGATTGV